MKYNVRIAEKGIYVFEIDVEKGEDPEEAAQAFWDGILEVGNINDYFLCVEDRYIELQVKEKKDD